MIFKIVTYNILNTSGKYFPFTYISYSIEYYYTV